MGGGNAQKSKTARERNLEKNKASKGSQLDANKKAMSIQYFLVYDPMKFCTLCYKVLKYTHKHVHTLPWVFYYDSNHPPFDVSCKVCMQTFICTTSEVKCREHAEAKHPKSDVYACFPHLKK